MIDSATGTISYMSDSSQCRKRRIPTQHLHKMCNVTGKWEEARELFFEIPVDVRVFIGRTEIICQLLIKFIRSQ